MKSLIVIGGATKCGTTSLFKYLADHPEVVGTSIKETRFFLEPDYPVSSQLRYARDGIDAYWRFFERIDSAEHFLDATPDYLYSESAPRDLWNNFRNRLRVVFLFRDPEARFGSWYRHAKRVGIIPEGTTYSKYLAMQVREPQIDTPQHLRALEQGRYELYLRAFARWVPPGQIFCMAFRELSQDPRAELRKLAEWLGLDPAFYDDYVFSVENKSTAIRWPALHHNYLRVIRWLRDRLWEYRGIHSLFRRLRRRMEPLYLRVNEKDRGEELELSHADIEKLESYYSRERAFLERLPWGPCAQWLEGRD